MAKFVISPNMDRYSERLMDLRINTREYLGNAVKKGAGPVADAIRSELDAVPVVSGYRMYGEKLPGLTATQKEGLSESLGIAPLRSDAGFLNVKVGFDGYNNQHTWNYPQGQPNAMIARSLESGSSWRVANPFISRGSRKSKDQAINVIQKEIEDTIAKWFGG